MSGFYLWLAVFGSLGHQTLKDEFLFPLWNITSAPFFYWFFPMVNVLFIAALLPGMACIFIFFLALGLVVNLAEVSPGAAGILVITISWLLFRKYREQLSRAIDHIAAVLTWIRHPQLRQNLRKIAQQGKILMDEKEDELRNQAVRIAEVLGLSQSQVPTQLADYDGFFQEARKRVQMRSLERTRERELVLLRQATSFYTEIVNLKRAQGAVARVDKENLAEDLQLDVKIKKLKQELNQEEEEPLSQQDPPSGDPSPPTSAGSIPAGKPIK